MWKYSFELVMRELDLAKKKQQALDELFTSEKISRSTYEYLEGDLKDVVRDLEIHLKSLMDKMTARAQELEKQICTLELFLANLEIHHAAGEIENEAYEKQNKAIVLGLEITKEELRDIRNSLSAIVSEPVKPTRPPEATEPEVSEAPTLVSPSEHPSTHVEHNP